jgi:hypothetical protein
MRLLACVVVAAATWAGHRRTPPDSRRSPNARRDPSAAVHESDAKRPVPDYDGRADEPATTGDVLLWFPRVVLFPLYLVSEFVIRRPIGALATVVEASG